MFKRMRYFLGLLTAREIQVCEMEEAYFDKICQLIHNETECWDKALRAKDSNEKFFWRQEAFIAQGRLIRFTTGRCK